MIVKLGLYKQAYVVTGPAFPPKKDKTGKMFVQYEVGLCVCCFYWYPQVIGKNHVAVPPTFFKAVAASHKDGSIHCKVSFIMFVEQKT